MFRLIVGPIISALAIAATLFVGSQLMSGEKEEEAPPPEVYVVQSQEETPVATLPPSTPLASATPTITLKPPPTLEPPTATPQPSTTPTITPTPTTQIEVSIPGLNGAESPTPSTTPGCEPREDWQLEYTVQRDDALANIAAKYGTYADVLAQGNCLRDKNLIVVGQVLRVPGEAHPEQPAFECVAYEGLTPANLSSIPDNGMVTFNWRGTLSPKTLLRIQRPDGSIYEQVIQFRQNEQITINEQLSQEGTYTWWVFPLNYDETTIFCANGGPWTFYQ